MPTRSPSFHRLLKVTVLATFLFAGVVRADSASESVSLASQWFTPQVDAASPYDIDACVNSARDDFDQQHFADSAAKYDIALALSQPQPGVMLFRAALAHWCASHDQRAINLWQLSKCERLTAVERENGFNSDCDIHPVHQCPRDSLAAAARTSPPPEQSATPNGAFRGNTGTSARGDVKLQALPETTPTAAPPPAAVPAPNSRPLYKSKALWLGLGGGVAAALTLGLVLGLQPWVDLNAPPDYVLMSVPRGTIAGSAPGFFRAVLPF